MPIVHINQL